VDKEKEGLLLGLSEQGGHRGKEDETDAMAAKLTRTGQLFGALRYASEKITATRIAASHGPPCLDPLTLMPFLTTEQPQTLAAILEAVRLTVP
jgi:hypothetical protein